MNIISNVQLSAEIPDIGGNIAMIFFIVSLILSLLLAGTKYWNRYVSDTFSMSFGPLLLTFMMVVIFKVILVI